MTFDKNLQLESENIVLSAIKIEDHDDLSTLAFHDDLWHYTATWVTQENLSDYIHSGINDWNNQTRYMFGIYSKKDKKTIGSTSIAAIDTRNRRVEIGWTWLGKPYQGMGINKECKYLLLRYCFETARLHRVEFKTDVNNIKARKALAKIGATEEGILRSHILLHRGEWRDTIYYSILDHEWEHIKKTRFHDTLHKPVEQ